MITRFWLYSVWLWFWLRLVLLHSLITWLSTARIKTTFFLIPGLRLVPEPYCNIFGTQIWPALVTTNYFFLIYEKLHSDNLWMIRSLVILCLQNDLMLNLLILSCCCCRLWWNPPAYHLEVYRICHSAVLPLYLPIELNIWLHILFMQGLLEISISFHRHHQVLRIFTVDALLSLYATIFSSCLFLRVSFHFSIWKACSNNN